MVTIFDSEESAQQNRLTLSIAPHRARALGSETVAILTAGEYTAPSGQLVDIRQSVQQAVSAKISLPPSSPLPQRSAQTRFETLHIAVRNQTTLDAAQQLRDEGKAKILALNFASPTDPGGGFRSGGRAQEEYLARSSALYATLRGDLMYTYHSQTRDPFATDWAILSPNVPVFRDDAGTLLEAPWPCAFLTCAAPIANLIPRGGADKPMRQRIARILDIARAHNYPHLILGAWGCGVFGHYPKTVATHFHNALLGEFAGDFETVVFAITDWSPERRYLVPFAAAFSDTSL